MTEVNYTFLSSRKKQNNLNLLVRDCHLVNIRCKGEYKNMKTLQDLRIIIPALVIFSIFGFGLTAAGANKTVPLNTKTVKKSQSTQVTPKANTKIMVPNVIGKTESQAKMVIKRLGLKIGKIEYQTRGKGKPNSVIKQKPKAGTYAVRGSQINLLVLIKKPVIPGKPISKEKYRGGKTPPQKRRGIKSAAPKIQKIGKDFYLIFPEAVKNVSVFGSSKKANQTFNFGKKFKISPSMKKTKDGKLIVKYTDPSGRPATHEMIISKYKIRARKSDALEPVPYDDELGQITFIKPGPNVGYMFQGDQYEIKLDGQGYIPEPCYSMLLYQGNTLVTDVALQKCGPTHMWTVPHIAQGTNIPIQGSNYRIKLVTLDNAITAWSGDFAILSSAPDVSVTNLKVTSSNPTSLEDITVRATVTNDGKTKVDSVSLELNVEAPDGSTFTFHFGSCSNLPFGQHCYIQKKIKVNRGGHYSLSANAKFILATAAETNLTNNTATGVMDVGGKPDLVICMYREQRIKIGQWTGIRFVVKNQGDANSSKTTVRLEIPLKGTETLDVPGLIPGSHNGGGSDHYMWLLSQDLWANAVVDPDNIVDERVEINNSNYSKIKLRYTNPGESDYTCDIDRLAAAGYVVYEVD